MNNMKKKLSVLLAIVIVLTSLIIPVSADTAGSTPDGAYINTGGTLYPVTKGDTYTYEYHLNLGKKLTAIDASLSYDTAGLELVNYTFPILGSSANVGTYGGKLYFNYASATGIEFSGSSAVLIRATFKVKAENGTFDVHTDIMDMARYQEVKIVDNGVELSSFTHNELITDDDSKTSIYIQTRNKYYKVKRGKTYNYICYLKTDERVGNLEATTKYSSDGLSTNKSSSYYDYYTRSVKTTYQSYSGKSFAEDNTVLVSIPFTVKSNAYDNTTYSISTNISKLQDINEDTISRYTVTEVIEGLSYTTYDPLTPPSEPPTEPATEPATEPPTEPPFEPTDNYGYVDGAYYLIGSINGDNSGTANVHKGLRFKDYSSDSMILEGVRLTQGDVVCVARYNGNNTFTVYPDGVGRDVSITQSGRYDFYFKPYELGNSNYWYITPYYLGSISPYLLGDADGNGELSSVDVAFILRYLAKIDTPFTKSELMRGDVDDSGDLELTDVTAIQYYLANMNTPYPIGTTIG